MVGISGPQPLGPPLNPALRSGGEQLATISDLIGRGLESKTFQVDNEAF